MRGIWSIAARSVGLLRRRDEGVMVVEAVLMLPLLFWAFAGSWVFFDAFRAQATNQRAAYTIGDVLSRESNYITPTYLDSLHTLQQFLVADGRTPRIRVSVFAYDAASDSYSVRWSNTRGIGIPALTDTLLAEMRDELPDMPDLRVATLIETWVDYAPLFEVGLAPFTFEDRVVTQLRFANQLCFKAMVNSDVRLC